MYTEVYIFISTSMYIFILAYIYTYIHLYYSITWCKHSYKHILHLQKSQLIHFDISINQHSHQPFPVNLPVHSILQDPRSRQWLGKSRRHAWHRRVETTAFPPREVFRHFPVDEDEMFLATDFWVIFDGSEGAKIIQNGSQSWGSMRPGVTKDVQKRIKKI